MLWELVITQKVGELPIDVAPVADANDEHDEAGVLDGVDDSEVADTNTPPAPIPLQLLRSRWAGVVCELVDLPADALPLTIV